MLVAISITGQLLSQADSLGFLVMVKGFWGRWARSREEAGYHGNRRETHGAEILNEVKKKIRNVLVKETRTQNAHSLVILHVLWILYKLS